MIEDYARSSNAYLPLTSLTYHLFNQTSSLTSDKDDDCNAMGIYVKGRNSLQGLRQASDPPPKSFNQYLE